MRRLGILVVASLLSPWPAGAQSPLDPVMAQLDAVDAWLMRQQLAGWTVDGDTVAPLTVVVLADGRPIASLPADRERLDVAAAVGYGPSRGFHTTVPVGPDTVQVCVVAVGTGSGPALGQLGCQVVK